MENLRNKIKPKLPICAKKKMADLPDRPRKAKKFKGSFQYKTKNNTIWFSQENLKNYKDVIMNSKLGEFYFYCKMYTKDVSCSHGGASDFGRHCNSVIHQKKEKEKCGQTSIGSFLVQRYKELFHRYSYTKS